MKEFVEYLIEEKENAMDKFLMGAVYVGIGLIVTMLTLYMILDTWFIVGTLGACIVFYYLGRFIIFLISCLLNCHK